MLVTDYTHVLLNFTILFFYKDAVIPFRDWKTHSFESDIYIAKYDLNL